MPGGRAGQLDDLGRGHAPKPWPISTAHAGPDLAYSKQNVPRIPPTEIAILDGTWARRHGACPGKGILGRAHKAYR